ncbi:heat-inducible transcription repressor HrcA [candidate division KSB1 bacterium]|nr:heat-inducible transcription repressor HrcA [candidate division KSB1 bacterium]
MHTLSKRQKTLLRHIIQNFIDTAAPVGSDYLVKKHRLDYSPATVRNEMMNLESMGFIQQPHTSAGRIPSDKGYRYYVGHLMRPEKLKYEYQDKIDAQISQFTGDVRKIFEEASGILGKISNELGLVLTPWMSNWVLDCLELISLSSQKVLVVIRVRSRNVKTVVLEIENEFSTKDLYNTASLLNERLSGLTLEEIKNTMYDRTRNVSGGNPGIIREMINSVDELFGLSDSAELLTAGTRNILLQPEFSQKEMMDAFLGLVENRRDLVRAMKDCCDEPQISIGNENKNNRLNAFSIVKAGYNIGGNSGTIGVIGPTRMPYNRILPLVNHVAASISHHLS